MTEKKSSPADRGFRVLCASSAAWLSSANVPRLLHQAGAAVTFLGPEDAWPLRGSFVAHWVAAEGSPAAVAETLCQHLQATAPYDWVVIGDDHLLAALAARRDEPWVRALLPIEPDDVRVGLFGSKVGFVRAAGALGLPLPWSRVCHGREEIRAAMEAWGAAVLVKEDALSGGQGCHLLHDVGMLAALPDSALAAPVVVQAFVRGPTYSVEALFDHGQLRATLTSQVVRSWPGRFGPSAVRRFVHHPELVALAERIGRTVGVHGFSNITVVEDPAEGRLLLIELDPRPNALFHLGDMLGVPMTRALRAMLDKRAEPEPAAHLAPATDVEVPVYPGDVLRCVLHGDIQGLVAWAFNLDGRWRFMPQGDPRMARAYRQHIVRQLARHLVPARVRAPLASALRRLAPDKTRAS